MAGRGGPHDVGGVEHRVRRNLHGEVRVASAARGGRYGCLPRKAGNCKGELEKFQGQKGLPDPIDLFNTILDEGGRIILCELALEAKDIKVEDIRDERIEILKAPPFLLDIQGAGLTFTF